MCGMYHLYVVIYIVIYCMLVVCMCYIIGVHCEHWNEKEIDVSVLCVCWHIIGEIVGDICVFGWGCSGLWWCPRMIFGVLLTMGGRVHGVVHGRRGAAGDIVMFHMITHRYIT